MSSRVRNLLSTGSTPLESLEKKLTDRRYKLQSAIIYGLESESALQLINERLISLEANARMRLISADLATVKMQDVENEANMKQLGELGSSFENVISKLRLKESAEEVSFVTGSVRKKSESMVLRLQMLEKVLADRHVVINKVRQLAEKFDGDIEKMASGSWLQSKELELESMKRDTGLTDSDFKERLLHLEVRIMFQGIFMI